MDIKLRTTKHRTITDSHNGSNNKQKVNNNRTTALERTAALATGGLKCILLVPNLCPRLFVVEVQEMFSSHGGHLTNAMYHHGKHSNQINNLSLLRDIKQLMFASSSIS